MTFRLATAIAAICCSFAAAAQSPPVRAVPVAPQAEGRVAPVPVRRPDERRSEQPVSVDLFGKPIELGLSYEVTNERRLDFDLDRSRQRGRDVLEHELKLDARWRSGAATTWFVQGVGLAERRKAMLDGAKTRTHSWERGQTWVLVDGLGGLPLSVQAGRIALIERRSWWWDDDLDALRLSYATSTLRVDTGVGRELLKRASVDAGIAPEQKGVTRWFGHANLRYAGDHAVEGFWLLADDRSGAPARGAVFDDGAQDESDGRLRWAGLRASGDFRSDSGHRLIYRADAALLRGRETRTPIDGAADGRLVAGDSHSRDVRGTAWDLGLQWRLPGDARPTFSLAMAQGSGGIDTDSEDRNFRQTGLQENKGRMAGVKRIRFYGELLDPELANLRVTSVGFGFRALSNSSAELLLHHYRQPVPSANLVGSRLSESPLGVNGELGHELDLLFALREWKHLELTLRLARFQPGDAFAEDRRDPAHSVEVGATLTF